MPLSLHGRLLLILLTLGGCEAQHGACDAPRAFLLSPEPSVLAQRLSAAGFQVEPLPLNRSPWGLSGLIVIGAGAASMPEYDAYMQAYADDLYYFVDEANVLLQLGQDADAEPEPPFLPSTHAARRSPVELVELEVIEPSHPLLVDAEVDGGRLSWRGALAPGAFAEQDGFQVVLAGRGDGTDAALLEGAYGQGRIILSALPLDASPGDEPEQESFHRAFYRNLAGHVSRVCAREGALVEPTPPAPAPLTPGSTTFAALPDTQVYALRYPGVFDSQTVWLAEHAAEMNLAYVFHLGDIVNNNSAVEWERARASMRLLEGVVPYAMVPGNHDYGPSGDASTRDTGLNTWFSFDDAARAPTFGGAYEPGRLDNTYHLFDAGGHPWIAVALEWGPRDAVVAWANEVMEAHPDRLGIFVTHAYLNNNDRRYDHTDTDHPQAFNPHEYDTPGGVNDGEELWDKLVRRHRFVLTLNGHVLGDGTGYLASTNDRGNVCHQMLANYQMRELGGEGYLRLLELLPDGRTLVVRTYSPLLDRYLLVADQNFSAALAVD